jgi:hypothetical protein
MIDRFFRTKFPGMNKLCSLHPRIIRERLAD